MDAHQRERKLREKHEAARFQFIRTELDLAMTFCRIALASGDAVKRERNAAYANRAYEVAKRFLEGSNLEVPESEAIQTKMDGLRALLDRLGAKR